MFSGSNAKKSLAANTAFLYGLVYIISSFTVFLGLYIIIKINLDNEIKNSLIEDAEELVMVLEEEGIEKLYKEIHYEAYEYGTENSFFRIFSPGAELLAESDIDEWENLEVDEDLIRALSSEKKGSYKISYFTLPEKKYKIIAIYSHLGSGYIIQIGLLMEKISVFLSLIRNTYIFLVVMIIFLTAYIAMFITRRALRGVDEVTKTAAEISQSGVLERRVEIRTRYMEIENLADTFNSMLNSIQTLVTELKEINDNIAHDLKTPITRIRGLAEVTLMGSNTSLEDYEALASDTIEESDNLLEILSSMLYISKADAGISIIVKEEINLSEIIETACDLFLPIAEEKGIKVNLSIPESCRFLGERKGIQRMISNLLDNAIKYSSDNGSINVLLMKSEKEIVISISDTGIGIPKEKLDHIFKRFYRCHENTDIPGVGLGLSMVNAIVKQHSGKISVESSLHKGTTFKITLPYH